MTLTARRQPDLGAGRQDWHIFDGDQRVARLYQCPVHPTQWLWFKQSVPAKNGVAQTWDEAKAALRAALDEGKG